MISAFWLIPTLIIGVIIGVFLLALVTVHRDDDE